MICILYIYIISDIKILCTFFRCFSGIFFRYIGYFAKNVNFPKKVFCSYFYLVVYTGDSSSVVPPSVGMTGLSGLFSFEFYFPRTFRMTGLRLFFIFTFSLGTYWRFLVEPSGFSIGMTLPIRHPEERSDVRIYSI